MDPRAKAEAERILAKQSEKARRRKKFNAGAKSLVKFSTSGT